MLRTVIFRVVLAAFVIGAFGLGGVTATRAWKSPGSGPFTIGHLFIIGAAPAFGSIFAPLTLIEGLYRPRSPSLCRDLQAAVFTWAATTVGTLVAFLQVVYTTALIQRGSFPGATAAAAHGLKLAIEQRHLLSSTAAFALPFAAVAVARLRALSLPTQIVLAALACLPIGLSGGEFRRTCAGLLVLLPIALCVADKLEARLFRPLHRGET